MTDGRSWPFWTFIALLAILHFLVHLGLGVGVAAPDLLTVAVLLGARRLRGSAAAALGFAFGLLRDSLSLSSFGADVVSLTLVGYLGARSRDFFVGDSLLFIGIYLFAGKWFHDVVYDLIAGSTMAGDMVVRLFVQAPLASLYAAAAGVVALVLYRIVVGAR
ncbi:MAG TPA: rod shape-determining protein MreD [Longimicrobiales bacterium]